MFQTQCCWLSLSSIKWPVAIYASSQTWLTEWHVSVGQVVALGGDHVHVLTFFILSLENYNANHRAVSSVADLVREVYPRKSKPVILHVLPLLWTLLASAPGSGATPGASSAMRTAMTSLVNSLYSQMGPSLVDHASNNSSVTPRMHQTLQDMLDNPWSLYPRGNQPLAKCLWTIQEIDYNQCTPRTVHLLRIWSAKGKMLLGSTWARPGCGQACSWSSVNISTLNAHPMPKESMCLIETSVIDLW